MTEVEVAGTGPPISQNIRAELARAGITHDQMRWHLTEKVVGMSRTAWRRRLTGDVSWRINELQCIADRLQVPLSRLTEGPGR
jgi:hypothetical protein